MIKRQKYIDGIRGILCILIMIGHYMGVYKYASNLGIFDDPTLNMILTNKFLYLLFNESFWLYGFFIISGYLISFSKPKTIAEVFISIIRIFLRFCIPIFSSVLIIYFLFLIFGVNNSKTSLLFTNTWFQSNCQVKPVWLDIFIDPFRVIFFGKSLFNTPFWPINFMFLSSAYIYIISYAKRYGNLKFLGIVITFFILSIFQSPVIFACLAGASVGWFKDEIKTLYKKKPLLFSIILILGLILSMIISKSKPSILYTYIFAFALIIVEVVEVFKVLFINKLSLFFGKISFGVYSFHFPILITIGSSLLLLFVDNGIKGVYSIIFTWIISFLITVILSIVYNVSFEKWSNNLLKFIDRKILIK